MGLGEFCRPQGGDLSEVLVLKALPEPRHGKLLTASHCCLLFCAFQPLHMLFPPAGIPFPFLLTPFVLSDLARNTASKKPTRIPSHLK